MHLADAEFISDLRLCAFVEVSHRQDLTFALGQAFQQLSRDHSILDGRPCSSVVRRHDRRRLIVVATAWGVEARWAVRVANIERLEHLVQIEFEVLGDLCRPRSPRQRVGEIFGGAPHLQ